MSRMTSGPRHPLVAQHMPGATRVHGKASPMVRTPNQGTSIKGYLAGGNGNYMTNQMPSTMEVDIQNIYASNRYLPKNLLQQNALFRQIYRYDSTAGACIELYSTMAWGAFDITGIKDRTIRHAYEDSFFNIGLEERLPWLTVDYLTVGKYCVHLLFNEKEGVWSDMIQHNPDYIRVTPVPLVNQDPILHFVPPQELRNLATRLITGGYRLDDPQLMKVLTTVATRQAVQLNGENTFYMPRRASGNDYYGTSIYTRILQLVLLESALMNANLLNAYRRAGPIRTISPKDDTTYAPEQLDALALMFMEADEDPVGSTIVLRESVDVNTLDSVNSQQWRAFDDWDTIQTAKLHALGFSESFLSGDATYGSAEINLSVFLERIRALRSTFTNDLMINRVALNLAKAMDFTYSTAAERSHRIRVKRAKTDADYILPTIAWAKNLSPIGDPEFIERLEKAKEMGVPVSLRTIASACGVDFEAELDQLPQDSRDKAEIKRYGGSTGGEDGDMMASLHDIKEFAGVPKGTKVDNDEYLKEFKGQVNAYNFRLLTPVELASCARAMKLEKNLREELPGMMFAAFQLYLKMRGMPYEKLQDGEIEKLETEIVKFEDDEVELADALYAGLKGLGINDAEDAANEVREETSLTLDDHSIQTLDRKTELEDGAIWQTEVDHEGKAKTDNLRDQMDVRSDDELDPMDMVNIEQKNIETADTLDDKIKLAIEKLEEKAKLGETPEESETRKIVQEAGKELGVPQEDDSVNSAIFDKCKELLKRDALIERLRQQVSEYSHASKVNDAIQRKLDQLEDVGQLKELVKKSLRVNTYVQELKQRIAKQVKIADLIRRMEVDRNMKRLRVKQLTELLRSTPAQVDGEVAVPLSAPVAKALPPPVNPYRFADASKSPASISVVRDEP